MVGFLKGFDLFFKFYFIMITYREIKWNSGLQSKNNEYHIVDKVQNVCVIKYIFDLSDNVVFVVLALYSRTETKFTVRIDAIL
jgi:hypothetical protein